MKLEGKCRSCRHRKIITDSDSGVEHPCDDCVYGPYITDYYEYDETEADD